MQKQFVESTEIPCHLLCTGPRLAGAAFLAARAIVHSFGMQDRCGTSRAIPAFTTGHTAIDFKGSHMTRTFLTASALALAASLSVSVAAAQAQPAQTATGATEDMLSLENPLASESPLDFGAPQFDRLTAEHYREAMHAGMREELAEVRAITVQRSAPTFENTIVALERSGALLDRARSLFFNMTSANTNPELQAIQREFAPKLAAHGNTIALDPALFARIKTVYDARESLGLDPEQKRLVERIFLGFARSGAMLEGAQRERFAAINERLATLSTQFSQNLIKDTADWTMVIEDEADLSGLSDDFRTAAAEAAKAAGHEGKWLITLQRSSVEPFLQFADNRELRQQAFEAWAKRGDNDDAEDNKAIITETLRLRAERAKLLGFTTHAQYQLADRMAKTPEAARALVEQVWEPALERAREERAEILAMMEQEGKDHELAAWDWRYYAEKVRQAKYDLSENELRPYFEMNSMIDAQFWVANQLFGLTFKEREDLPVYDETVRVWEVNDAKGEHVGLFYGDYVARPNKSSGAWMSSYRTQSKLDGETTPIVVNVLSTAGGETNLLSYDSANTLFHEFGHGLHGLLSDVTYPSLAGTSVATDFVELPSQLYEHWLLTPEVLSRFARHYETGEPMPQELVDRLIAAQNFNQGFATVEFLSSAIVDLDFHELDEIPEDFDPVAFEKASLERIGMPAEMVMRHRPPHFGHIFSGGYSAGYYAYLWSEILDADGFEAFEEAGDVFDKETADKLYKYVYSGGNTRDWNAAYLGFRGREPSVDPLLRGRGFLPEEPES
jgi:peptidyl-dipeptidase Dcp